MPLHALSQIIWHTTSSKTLHVSVPSLLHMFSHHHFPSRSLQQHLMMSDMQFRSQTTGDTSVAQMIMIRRPKSSCIISCTSLDKPFLNAWRPPSSTSGKTTTHHQHPEHSKGHQPRHRIGNHGVLATTWILRRSVISHRNRVIVRILSIRGFQLNSDTGSINSIVRYLSLIIEFQVVR